MSQSFQIHSDPELWASLDMDVERFANENDLLRRHGQQHLHGSNQGDCRVHHDGKPAAGSLSHSPVNVPICEPERRSACFEK